MSDPLSRISRRFLAAFPPGRTAWRTVGRESEYPVVHADGRAADIAVLWPLLTEEGSWRYKKEGELIVAAEGQGCTFEAEVGRGTIEIVTPPTEDLYQTAALSEEAFGRLARAVERAGLKLLGYGIQPLTPPSPELQTPKQRYGVLLEVLGETWLWFTVTSSDQVHARVGQEEVVALHNLGNLLAPVTVALLANSPIYAGQPCGALSARELTMGRIHGASFRHGMPAGPAADAEALCRDWAGHQHLMEKVGGRVVPASGSFAQWLSAQQEPEGEAAFEAFLYHEHYIWSSARARAVHGTIEMRAACQQPHGESMVASALGFAMMEAGADLGAWLEAEMGAEAWPAMRAWHHEVIHHGLRASPPFPGLLEGLLQRCETALERRGRGEERLLAPLWRRLSQRQSPADAALAAYEAGGMPALIGHLSAGA